LGIIPKGVEVVLRILRPESALELSKLDAAHAKPADPTLHALEPVFYTAARLGVAFGINTLREATQLRKSLELRPEKLQGIATTARTPPGRDLAAPGVVRQFTTGPLGIQTELRGSKW
jgi:hypothetical protein